MNTDPQPNMAVISQSDLDRLKYELEMALRSERALLEALELAWSLLTEDCGFSPEDETQIEAAIHNALEKDQ